METIVRLTGTGISILPLITICALLILIGVICLIVYRVKRKVREFSRTVFGTDTLQEAFGQIEEEYVSTPKSVSALTSLYLPKIKEDFPDFSYDEMKTKAINVLTTYLVAINNRSVSQLAEGNSELKTKLETHLLQLENAGKREHFENIRIHRTEISDYKKREGRLVITFQSSIEYVHYITQAGSTVDKKPQKTQSRYEVDLIYIQDRNMSEANMQGGLALNCPNCGGALTGLGSDKCPYCLTPVIKLNIHAWSFSDVREKL